MFMTAIQLSRDGNSAVVNGTLKNWAGGVVQDSGDFGPADERPSRVEGVAFVNAGVSSITYMSQVTVRKSSSTGSTLSVYDSAVHISATSFAHCAVDVVHAGATVTGSTLVRSALTIELQSTVPISSSVLDGRGPARAAGPADPGSPVAASADSAVHIAGRVPPPVPSSVAMSSSATRAAASVRRQRV